MSKAAIERRLADVASEAKRLRTELAVIDEQLVHFAADADDLRLRSIVAETAQAGREHREAERTVAALRKDRDAKAGRLAELDAKQDDLLDQLMGA